MSLLPELDDPFGVVLQICRAYGAAMGETGSQVEDGLAQRRRREICVVPRQPEV